MAEKSVPTPFRLLTLLTLFASLAALAPAQNEPLMSGSSPTNIGKVYPSGAREPLVVSVTPFDTAGAPAAGGTFESVIANDLVLSGYFQPPRNIQFAEETHRLDKSRGSIQFADWARIPVEYIVKGQYVIAGDRLRAELRVYDAVNGTYIFGMAYENAAVNLRSMAHQMSNDIQFTITGIQGVADTEIAFVRQAAEGRGKQIAVMDYDGANPRALTSPNYLAATPSWGARGTELYYTTTEDYNLDLQGMIVPTRATWWISRRAGLNISPAWSVTRQLIALTMTRDGNSELYTVTREGGSLERLTVNRAIDSSPAWSPDGSRLAFTSDRTGNPQIHILDVGTREVTRLTYSGRYNDGAAWSPDGETIAFSTRVDDVFHIATIRADGTDFRILTTGPSNNEDPTWSPNGDLIPFSSERTGTKQVYLMFKDGQNIHQLTRDRLPSQSPAWGPSRQPAAR